MLGRTVADTLVPPAHRADHLRALAHFRASGEGPILRRRLELSALHQDGHEFPIELTVTPLRPGRREPFVAFIRDITEEVRAKQALAESEASHRALVDHAAFGIFRASSDDQFLSANPALVRMLGYDTEGELLALNIARDVFADQAERDRVLALRAQGEGTIETEWRHSSGRRITVRLTGRVVRNHDGSMAYTEVFAENVTDRYQRHGPRHGCRDPVASVRAVLHDQGDRERNGPRPRDGLRHRETERRVHLLRLGGRPWHVVPDLPAGGGRSTRGRPGPAGGFHERLRDHPARGGRASRPPVVGADPRQTRLHDPDGFGRRRGAGGRRGPSRADPPARDRCGDARDERCRAGPPLGRAAARPARAVRVGVYGRRNRPPRGPGPGSGARRKTVSPDELARHVRRVLDRPGAAERPAP